MASLSNQISQKLVEIRTKVVVECHCVHCFKKTFDVTDWALQAIEEGKWEEFCQKYTIMSVVSTDVPHFWIACSKNCKH